MHGLRPVELIRGLLVAAVLAWLARGLELAGWTGALQLSLVLWVGLPVVLLAGSVFHERVPWMLATLHVGDWLVKLFVISLVVMLWP